MHGTGGLLRADKHGPVRQEFGHAHVTELAQTPRPHSGLDACCCGCCFDFFFLSKIEFKRSTRRIHICIYIHTLGDCKSCLCFAQENKTIHSVDKPTVGGGISKG